MYIFSEKQVWKPYIADTMNNNEYIDTFTYSYVQRSRIWLISCNSSLKTLVSHGFDQNTYYAMHWYKNRLPQQTTIYDSIRSVK